MGRGGDGAISMSFAEFHGDGARDVTENLTFEGVQKMIMIGSTRWHYKR